MNRQYFTYRVLRLGKSEYSPNEIFVRQEKVFAGLPDGSVKWKHVISAPNVDGRFLAYFEYDSNLITQDVIEETLSPYSYHPKTNEKAVEFANYVTGLTCLTMDENGDIIGWPEVEI